MTATFGRRSRDWSRPLARERARDHSIYEAFSGSLRDGRRGIGVAEDGAVRSANQASLVLGIFILTQVLDGTLTYWGVSQFGFGIE